MKKKRSKQARIASSVALFLAILATACLPSITPQAQSTPRVLTVASTPATQPLNPVFQSCAEALGNTGLVLLTSPAQTFDLNKVPLALRWGSFKHANSYAAVLGQEDLVLVTNPKSPIPHINLAELKSIYTGTPRTGNGAPQAAEIHAWAYPSGDDVEDIFEMVVIGAAASPRLTAIAPDPAAMRAAVSNDPAAIGFLPRRWLDSTVKPLAIDGLNPANLRQPILSISKTEPTGLEKSWLLCIEERLKE